MTTADLGYGPQFRFSGATSGEFINIGQDKIGGFETYGYWSSSEKSQKTAWIQSFSVGYDFAEGIHKTFSVRAVRSLILKDEKVIPK